MNTDENTRRSATAEEIREWDQTHDEPHPVFAVSHRPERTPIDDSTVDLPIAPTPRHSPSTTAWEVRAERETLGLDCSDRVRPLAALSSTTPIDADRVHCRGRVWHRHDHRTDPGGSVNLAGECGSLRVLVEDQDRMDQLTEDVGVTIKNLRVDGEGFGREFIVDDETEILTWDKASKQRTNLMSLAMLDNWPVRKRVEADEDDVRGALEERVAHLENELARYGTVAVGVGYDSTDRWKPQLSLRISFDQLLLPCDIVYVYRTIAGVDGINWMHDSRRGTFIRGIRYEVSK